MNVEPSDESLMLAFQAGKQEAFEILVKRHQHKVFNFIFRFIGNREEAEELLQEVFVRIFKSVAEYSPVGKFKTWLFTVTRNLCVDHYRKKRIRKVQSLDELQEDGETPRLEQVESNNVGPEVQSSANELERILEWALAQVNEDQREVFLLREKFGFKFEEIADMTKVSVNTVKSRMRYASEGLKRAIETTKFKDLVKI
ncbi:MAG: RNA polymerase sigma-70 factor, ECF subfamily [Candidatus Curtissbacteria bacterium GW2011_GWC2_38_9]|uniref:RNA polymerase sigma factor n=1 Tax=Candidatus Curtissbacteria bacterium GW2011_GWC2_38_9 TaxID=1618414 RepID=A0A0G0PFD4_9BACT|nr:MAG: RNA polymerase sigma-70 factor, ECF subfamily [Candidatus Curtissbacteria bacterium GW2011_GWC2_38_9]